MTIFNLQLNLPDKIIQEAKQYGLLDAQTIEKFIQTELQRHRINDLLKVADRVAMCGIRPLAETEIAEEIQAIRAKK